MNRRRFLQLLGMAGAAVAIAPSLVLDPERALWVPGEKTIFDLGAPAPELYDVITDVGAAGDELLIASGGRNTILTIDVITREALRMFEQQLTFIKAINRTYDERFVSDVGRTVNIPRPSRFYTVPPAPDPIPVRVVRAWIDEAEPA